MCGIAGEINLIHKVKPNNSYLKYLAHRGPDSSNKVIINDNICFYHTRLKIIDLTKNSNQPMLSEDQRFVITYNGELYNYLEIRKSLKNLGVKFSTSGDTEVFLKGFIKYGKSFFKMANGIFAFAIYDKKEKKLFLARDFIGVKPLYYYHDNERLIFSSEAKAILANIYKKELNTELLNEYLTFKYISGKNTLIKNIYKLDPGKLYIVDLKKNFIKFEKYIFFKFQEKNNNLSLKNQIEKTNSLLNNSVKLQSQSDVNLGLQLSGGIDSTLIAELGCKYRKIENSFLSSFKNYKNNEFIYASKVSRKLNIKLKNIELTKKFFFKNFSHSIYFLDEPINHPHTIAIVQISKHAKKKISVMLAGEGADEIFFGYERYKNISDINSINKCINNGSFLRTKEDLNLYEMLSFKNYGNPIQNRKKIFNSIDIDNGFKKFQLFECYTHLQSLLLRSDKMMMANSIEARVPFLDINLFNDSINISDKIKKNIEQKLILKEILKQLGYEKKFLSRKKVGYLVPYNQWLLKKKNFKKELFDENLLKLFNKKSLEIISEQLSNNQNIYSNAKIYWLLTNLSNFIKNFKLEI